MRSAITLLLIVLAYMPSASFAQNGPAVEEQRVDFRYALPWWQSAICLPDDSDKVLVGKEGQILLDFGDDAAKGLRSFGICLQPEFVGGAKWVRQQTISPRAPVVQTWKDAAGVEVLEEVFVVTPKSGEPWGQADSARRIVLLVTFKNPTGAEATVQPGLHIQSVKPSQWNDKEGSVAVGPHTRIAASEPIKAFDPKSPAEAKALLSPITLAPGATRQVVFTVDRRSNRPAAVPTAAEACALRDAASRWWSTSNLPFETIQIPDAGVQAMIESCVRNIWQAREIKNGKPAFHVGPTVYRGLWVVDGSFLLEAAAILDRAKEARAGVEYMLSHQKPDGSFALLDPHFWKENGIVLWAVTRHASLTQDKAWLRAQWPALQRTVKAMERLRSKTLKDPQAPNYGLLPGGQVDGGIDNREALKAEYSNTHWSLTGLNAAIAAAHWLGEEGDATAWQKEYDAFYQAFRKAAVRDLLKDKAGNAYVPIMIGNADNLTPQKGQWTFCHAIYPGKVFSAGDPLAEGQMAMLRATKVEGMVFDTGWMRDGIWTYFASFYGHAALWMGHGDEAAQMLYDFANHAVPTRVWREEQKPQGKGVEEVGDMPHNWASAEFIRLATHLLELDRGNELHLLEGMPKQWRKAGMVTRLNGVPTPFGPLVMSVTVDRSGKTAELDVKPLSAHCKKIVVHLPDGTLRALPPVEGGRLTFDVPCSR
jgi:hypothetical protein